MRKILLFPVILALCVVNMGADAATRRGGAPAATDAAKPTVSARAATVRATQKTNANKPAAPTNTGVTNARAAKKQTVAKPSTGNVAARAGSKQKVISSGTKVETQASNTVVSQECQDAFYGCMDAFCMVDNVSGGRCQCNDRNAELDTVLEEILKLDEQSYALATEGVERIQMGENADLIMSRAKSAADKVAKQTLADKATETRKKKTLDLSLWNTNMFSDSDEDEDIFSGLGEQEENTDFINKKGDELQAAAARLCVKQMPEQCASSTTLLKSIYAQKVRSDCSAYENSLRQQKIASQQKLQAAEKALRDTALEMYENENKYDLGQCMIQYKQCLQTTAECGTDFSGCIADTAILQALYNKSGNKNIATTAVKTGATTITISSATYDILGQKRLMCENVTKQCVNANKNDAVWKAVLKEIVPAVYTAEYNAASNSRMNCISTAVSCVQKVCGSQWDENSDNYDACLSEPDIVAASCKLELNRCGGVGESIDVQKKVWSYVEAKLAALRVDKCTQEVKACLTKEDNCGEDYSNCIGLDTDTIVDFCVSSNPDGGKGGAADQLLACQTKFDSSTVRDYVARVAQGIALNIDNNFAQQCQNAADAAMERVCGDTESCANFSFNEKIGGSTLKYQVCQLILNNETGEAKYNLGACKDSVELVTQEELGLDTFTAQNNRVKGSESSGKDPWSFTVLYTGLFSYGSIKGSASQSKINYINVPSYTLQQNEVTMYQPNITGEFNWNTAISMRMSSSQKKLKFYNNLKQPGEDATDAEKEQYNQVAEIVKGMNNSLDQVMTAIETDTTVDQCMNGRDFQGISATAERKDNNGRGVKKGRKNGKEDDEGNTVTDAGRFANLTKGLRQIVASQIYNDAMNTYNEKLAELQEKRDADFLTISSKYEEVRAKNDKMALNQRLATNCAALNADNSEWNYRERVTTTYNEGTQTCIKTIRTQTCKTAKNADKPGSRTCTEWNAAKETTQTINMG